MMHLTRTCQQWFDQPAEDLWRVFSQLSSVLEHMGLEEHVMKGTGHGDALYRSAYSAAEKGRSPQLLFREKPLEWVKEKYLFLERIYLKKPYTNWSLRIDIVTQDIGVLVTCTVSAAPKSGYIRQKRTKATLNKQKEKLETLFDTMRLYFEKDLLNPFPRQPYVKIPKAAHQIRERIEKSGFSHGMGNRLLYLSFLGLTSEVRSIRPHHLAQAWKKPLLNVTELLMSAAHEGLLAYQWYMDCSYCGHSQAPTERLDRLPKSHVCTSCRREFTRDFSENVEIVFAPHPRFRKISQKRNYAFINPSRRRRTLFYVYVEAHQSLSLDIPLELDEVLTCFIDQTGEMMSFHEPSAKGLNIVLTPEDITYAPHTAKRGRSVHIQNQRDTGMYISLRTTYSQHMRYTGMEAITSHAFRELCPEDVPDRADEIPLSRATIMFTDLKGSTQLYEHVGDLRAYHMVRDHFKVIEQCVRQYDGALVKNMGDAVMAAFTRPVDAVKAGVAIHNEMNIFNQQYTHRQVILKMGIHTGPCIAVLMNGRVDFFGQMTNVAARLQDKSSGHDMVLSLPVVADPEVAGVLRPYPTVSEEEYLKGVDEKVPFLRVNFGESLFEEELAEDDDTF